MTPKLLSNRLVDSWWALRLDLQCVLETLRAHESDLRRLGVVHAAVFGSVARGDGNRLMGIFECARMKLYINEFLERPRDAVNRGTLKPLLRASILYDAIHAF